jgi:uncharacterized protein YkwD
MIPFSVHRFAFCFACCLAALVPVSCKKDSALPEGRLLPEMADSVNLLRSRGCRCGTDSMPPAPPLTWNAQLGAAAAAHAKDMYVRNYFSHISPEGSSPIQRAQQAGYTGSYVGENIAKGYASISDVMPAWRMSEAHCKAMMDTLYKEISACEYGGYWVQEFGR